MVYTTKGDIKMEQKDIEKLEKIADLIENMNVNMLKILDIGMMSDEAEECFSKDYPFNKSFDELYYDVYSWYESIRENCRNFKHKEV